MSCRRLAEQPLVGDPPLLAADHVADLDGAAPLVAVLLQQPLHGNVALVHVEMCIRDSPSGVGTRVAKPSSLPLSSGSTSETARAAPVVVGIMDMAAARARRRSLCGRSRIFWSFVSERIVFM